MFSHNASSIPINYVTGDYNISLNLTFGEGKDSENVKNENERKNFNESYNIEVYEVFDGEDYKKGYRILCNEGAFVVKLSNIEIQKINNNERENYEYAIGFALDNEKPEYYGEMSTIPYNIERDGTLWTIPANKGSSFNFDQNPKAKYQWVAKRALDINYEPTEEEVELGMEKTNENTGVIYLTFMIYKKPKVQEPTRGFTRGITRGATRGATRGICDDVLQKESDAARFGYGNEASSSSVKSEYEYVKNTEKYTLPIRLRINKTSEKSNINCSRNLSGANINTLKRQTMTVPF